MQRCHVTTKVSLVRTPVDVRLLYPSIGLAYVTGYLKSMDYDVKQIDLAAEEKLDLRLKLGLAECSRTNRTMLKVLFMDEYGVSPEEIHRDLMTEEVKHVSILPTDYNVEDVSRVLKSIRNLTERCVNRIRQTPTVDVVGFHVTWDSTLLSLLAAKKLKEIDKDLNIVFGGPDCSRSFRGKMIPHFDFVDAVATGEGETSIRQLLDAWSKKRNLDVRGCITSANGKVVDHGEAELIHDLDTLPFPDYSDLPLKSYTAFYALPILSSRGCKYNCTFCVDRTAVWNRSYRERSIGNVLKEILHLCDKYPIKALYFCDSSLNPTLQRLNNLCEGFKEIKKRIGRELYWGGDIRARPLSRSTVKQMHNAGCRYLMFGAESGSQKILNSMRKGVTTNNMADAFKWAKEAGIWVFTYWIVGYPGETPEDLYESMKFLSGNYENIDEACIAPCEVGYGSELYERSKSLKIRFLKSEITLREELARFERYSRGYKTWTDQSGANTPSERLYRRVIFEAVARSLGYPSNWAIWPPMPPIDRLSSEDIPVTVEYSIHKVESRLNEEEIYVEPTSTMESVKVSALQLRILGLCDGSRNVMQISEMIQKSGKTANSLNETFEDCSKILGEMVRREIVKLKT
jgi:hypothetical protein